MDKQMIEEMVEAMGNWALRNNMCWNEGHAKSLAEALYNAGYRKIPEGAVVLTREEYECLVKTAQDKIGNMKLNDFLKACISSGVMVEAVSTEEQVKQAYEKGSKETAEKFAVFRKYITEQFHHYHEIRDKMESDYKKEKEEVGKSVLNNDWHRADAIMFILEKVGIEFDEIAKELIGEK